MAKNKKKVSTEESSYLVDIVVSGMEEMKAEAITIINLTKIKNAVADYFIVCSGNSDSHVDAIAESVDKEVFLKTNQNPWRKEGRQNREWILIDYVNIVAHVFKKEQRKLYDLEALWGDGIITHVKSKDVIPGNDSSKKSESKKVDKIITAAPVVAKVKPTAKKTVITADLNIPAVEKPKKSSAKSKEIAPVKKATTKKKTLKVEEVAPKKKASKSKEIEPVAKATTKAKVEKVAKMEQVASKKSSVKKEKSSEKAEVPKKKVAKKK